MQELVPGGRVLDLCSSFNSHLPPVSLLPLEGVIGHGLNDAELLANSRLDRHFLLDLNAAGADLLLPLGNGQVGNAAYWRCRPGKAYDGGKATCTACVVG